MSLAARKWCRVGRCRPSPRASRSPPPPGASRVSLEETAVLRSAGPLLIAALRATAPHKALVNKDRLSSNPTRAKGGISKSGAPRGRGHTAQTESDLCLRNHQLEQDLKYRRSSTVDNASDKDDCLGFRPFNRPHRALQSRGDRSRREFYRVARFCRSHCRSTRTSRGVAL